MNEQELAQLSDEELLKVAENMKPSPLIDAYFIGFLIGIILFSIASNALGFITLLPLFLIYIFLKKPKKYQVLNKEMKKRNLK